MWDLIVWILSGKNTPLVVGIVVVLVLEFGLDVVHDVFMDWFRSRRTK